MKSQKFKVDIIKGLLVRAQGQEAKFIIRGLQGKLRIGLAQSTVLISLARALTLTVPKTIKKLNDDELAMILTGKTKGMDFFFKVENLSFPKYLLILFFFFARKIFK